MNFGGGLQDQMLKTYIDQIFDKYDTDRSGTLDEKEMTFFFNDLFKSLGMNINVTEAQSLEAIKSIDQNYDGGVDKKELFDAFKLMMNKSNQPPPQQQPITNGGYGSMHQPTGYNPYQPQNPYGQQNPYQQQPNSYNMYGQSNPYMQQNSYNPYVQPNPYMQPQNPYIQPQNPYMQPQNPYQNPYNQNGYMGGSSYGGGWGRRTR